MSGSKPKNVVEWTQLLLINYRNHARPSQMFPFCDEKTFTRFTYRITRTWQRQLQMPIKNTPPFPPSSPPFCCGGWLLMPAVATGRSEDTRARAPHAVRHNNVERSTRLGH
jgi:hypothetical protein